MRSLGRTAAPVVLAVLSSLVTGCSDVQATDLCTKYKQVSSRAQEIKGLKPSAQSINELRGKLTNFEASLDQLQAVSDGPLDQAITDLRTAVQDFVEAAVANGRKAKETAEPLLVDSRDEVAKQWGLLKQRADAECGTTS
jgi:hypothetical protein